MESFDVVIAGSGPGATFAAYGARGRRILMLDAGHDVGEARIQGGNLYEQRRERADLFAPLIGENFESLHNLRGRRTSLKLKSPYLSFVARDWEHLTPVANDDFEGAISLAKGGLANAWGGGVYRFNDAELAQFPLCPGDLQPYYDEVTAHIGVCGSNDALARYFGEDSKLLPPLRLSSFFAELTRRYARTETAFRRERVTIGRPRLAVLSESRGGRSPYAYENLEFFRAHDPAIYTPAYTVNEMIRSSAIEYRPGHLVTHYRETEEDVTVCARRMDTGEEVVNRGRKFLIGAGALNTARIVLQSTRDYETRLPALDNPMACIPFFNLSRIGLPLEVRDTSLAQLILVAEDASWSEPLQASFYGTTGPLRSDVMGGLPLSLRANLTWTKYLAPAMGLLMLFYPGLRSGGGYLRLLPSGALDVRFPRMPEQGIERRLIRLLRKMGYLAHPALTQRPGDGAGLHYAGMLPMRANPGRYETNPQGLLSGSRHVYIVDGACFSALPAKNLTLTIMANALRIGRGLR